MRTEFILTLLETSGFGKISVKKVLESNHSCINDLTELREAIEITSKTSKRLSIPSLDQLKKGNDLANDILFKSEIAGIDIVDLNSKYYPKQLKDIDNSPIIIHCRGNLELLNEYNNIAVIGTREPSSAGIRLGERITEIFVKRGLNIVSGLAIGCDTIGHRVCLNNNGKTIAILASGVDHIYPKENKLLSEEIIEKEGVLFSEYPIGRKPMNNFFVERDRLQSGMSQAICVIETDIKGGTMHTVGFAEKQNRLVACINHPIENRNHPKVNRNQKVINTKRAYSLGNPDEINLFIELLNQKIIDTQSKFNQSSIPNNNDESQLKLNL
jgi:DNA processing protein